MTPEQSKEFAKVVKAHSEGYTIQYKNYGSNMDWTDTNNPTWDVLNTQYRIKPHQGLIPYSSRKDFFADYSAKGRMVEDKRTKVWRTVNDITPTGFFIGSMMYDFYDLMVNFNFIDGTPCGKYGIVDENER